MNPENPPPSGQDGKGSGRFGSDQGWPKWMIWVLLGVLVAALFLPTLLSTSKGTDVAYGDFIEKLRDDQVKSAEFDNTNGQITGEFTDGTQFNTTGPVQLSDGDVALFTEKGVKFTTPTSSIWETLLPLL